MLLLWTTRPNHPTSKLIRWGLSEESSHFAICFFIGEGAIVLEQVMTCGFRVTWLDKFLKHNKVVYALQPNGLTEKESRRLFEALMSRFSGSGYDYGSFAYFCWRVFLLKFVGAPLPDKSQWGDKDVLCTGLAKVVQEIKPEWLSTRITDFDIVSPGLLYDNMLDSNHFINKSPMGILSTNGVSL